MNIFLIMEILDHILEIVLWVLNNWPDIHSVILQLIQ